MKNNNPEKGLTEKKTLPEKSSHGASLECGSLEYLDNEISKLRENVQNLKTHSRSNSSPVKNNSDIIYGSGDEKKQENLSILQLLPKEFQMAGALPKDKIGKCIDSKSTETAGMENMNEEISRNKSHTKLSGEMYKSLKKSLILNKKSRFDLGQLLPELNLSEKNISHLRRNIHLVNNSVKEVSGKNADELYTEQWEQLVQYSSMIPEKTTKDTKELLEEDSLADFIIDGNVNNIINQNNTISDIVPSENYVAEIYPSGFQGYSNNIPIDSPLYSLLIGYEELKTCSINLEKWIELIPDCRTELNYLLRKNNMKGLKKGEIINLKENLKIALSVLDELKIAMGEEKKTELPIHFKNKDIQELIEDLEALNREIYELSGKILPSEENETIIIDSLEEHIRKLPDEQFKTQNYLELEKIVSGFLNGTVSKAIFLETLNKMSELIEESTDKYKTLQIGDEELTREIFKANKIIYDALEDWQQGIVFMKDYLKTGDREDIYDGLKAILEASKKLVYIQYFARQVEKQAHLRSF